MSNIDPPNIFLDTSALFAAILSDTGGAREILRLGMISLMRVLVSQDVLAELEDNLNRKAPRRLLEHHTDFTPDKQGSKR